MSPSRVAPADFWVSSNAALGVPDIQKAYALIFGQGLWTIGGSIVAFLIGQLVDVTIFHRIRRVTGERWCGCAPRGRRRCLRSLDSFVVLYIAFVIGPQKWPVSQFLAVGTVNYLYKMSAAIALIPLAVSDATADRALSWRPDTSPRRMRARRPAQS